MTILGSPVPLPFQAIDNNGDPVANGSILVQIANTASNKTVYSDAALTTPVTQGTYGATLDSAGRIALFWGTGPVDVTIYDANNVAVPGAQVLAVENVAKTYLEILGNTNCAGQRGMTTGGTITSTDYLVTVNSSGTNPTVINLPAATVGHQVTIQNVGTNPVAITPHGSDSINALSASAVYTMPAAVAASQIYPTSLMYPDGTSNWRTLPAFPPSTQVLALAAGVKLASGNASLASGTATIVSGLTTISSVELSLNRGAVPSTTGAAGIGYNVTGGSIAVISWKADGSAATGTEGFSWMATGA